MEQGHISALIAMRFSGQTMETPQVCCTPILGIRPITDLRFLNLQMWCLQNKLLGCQNQNTFFSRLLQSKEDFIAVHGPSPFTEINCFTPWSTLETILSREVLTQNMFHQF